MEVIHLNQKQLAARWHLSEATLERWRTEGIGPKFLKLLGRVIYRVVDIEAFEESCLSTSTKMINNRLPVQV
jgi:hypothetical protein